MKIQTRGVVVILAAGGACILCAPAVRAEDTRIERLEAAIERIEARHQAEIRSLQAEIRQLRRQKPATAAAQSIPANLYNAAPAGSGPMATRAAAPSWFGAVHVSLAGSFVAFDGVWRNHNEVASPSGDPGYATLPFQNSPLWHENETRFSSQSSRIALRATGDIDPAQHLTGYWEADFQAAASTTNTRGTNGYSMRLRQAWMFYDNDNWHSHFLAGQAWSMLTANKMGILPGTENIPVTITQQYVVGFNYSRQPQVRFVQDWNKAVWFGVSVENPQTHFFSNGNGVAGAAALSANNGTIVPPGLGVNPGNNCNGSAGLNPLTECSNNTYPDIIEKVAFDPGWGHYEAFAIQRWFTDEVAATGAPFLPAGAVSPGWQEKTNFAWGGGGSVLLPVWDKVLDLQGSFAMGKGMGRYGSSLLPDVTIGPDGTLKPLQTTQVLLGAIVHPWTGLDFYAYAGEEDVKANFWTVKGTNGGWGNPSYPDGGCSNEVTTSTFGAAYNVNSATTCTANVKRTQELTVGFWQNVYKGDLGTMRIGAQYEFVRLEAFQGSPKVSPANGPTPNLGLNPYNNVVFVSLRYYPFN
jgi:hypothetical protein